MNRNYAPSVADTMSVWSGPSVHGSIYGAGEQKKEIPIQIPKFEKKPPVPRLTFNKPELKGNNPYAQIPKPASQKGGARSVRRPMSVAAGSKKQAKATGNFNMVPGMGPFLPQGAAKVVSRGVWKGGKPKPTGVFDAKTVFEPTEFSRMYQNGDLPCLIDNAGEPGPPEKGAPAAKKLFWLTPPKHVNLKKYFGVFVEGLQEKSDPLAFMAQKGLEDIIDKGTVKSLLLDLRTVVYPIKNNIKTLDDDICSKTLKIMLRLAQKSDKIAEAFIPHFPIILPSMDLLKNKQSVMSGATRRPKSSVTEQRERKPPIKLAQLKIKKPGEITDQIQELLEYFERHGGIYAFVTIKKLMPRYESVLFS